MTRWLSVGLVLLLVLAMIAMFVCAGLLSLTSDQQGALLAGALVCGIGAILAGVVHE